MLDTFIEGDSVAHTSIPDPDMFFLLNVCIYIARSVDGLGQVVL